MRLAGSRHSSEGGWRVFVSHTSELRDYPRGDSYVAAVERAVSAAGHVIVDATDFPAVDALPARLDIERVRSCDVYVGLLGTSYGSLVPDRPETSYTELEFETATEVGLARLVFLLDTDAADVGIPLSRLIDQENGIRQMKFRRRVQEMVTTHLFADPVTLKRLVERSLQELGSTRKRPPIRVFIASGENVEATAWLADYLKTSGLIVVNSTAEHVMVSGAAADISNADAVVGDISGGDPNTFFELGLAQAFEIPTVLLVNKNDQTSLPTELARAPVVFYDDFEPPAAGASVLRAIERLAG